MVIYVTHHFTRSDISKYRNPEKVRQRKSTDVKLLECSRGGGDVIRQVDKSRFNIPTSGHPKLHRELMWYATDDDTVLGVIILDLVDKDFLARADQKRPGARLHSDRYGSITPYGG